jgi:Domain of unknown function (DUF4386)
MADARRIAVVALIAGPLLFLVSNLLHPKELATGNEAEQLEAIAEAYQRWQVAHLITYVAILFFAAAVVALAALLWRHNTRTALWGGVLGVAGLMSLMGVLALDGFSWAIAGEVWGSDPAYRPAAERMLKDLQSSEWGLMFYVPGLLWIIGMVVLALGLIRHGLVPSWAGWMLAAGSLLVGLEGAIHSNVYFVIAALALLAGGTAVALSLRQPPEVAP